MLKNEIISSVLFKEISPIADALNLVVVDTYKNIINQNDIQVCIVVMNKNGDASIEDCEKLHRAVQPRLELSIGRDNLSMEVSTPGLQRNFKDIYEFSIFVGRQVRVYSSDYSSWIEGVISSTTDDSVLLDNYLIVDKNESGKSLEVKFSCISKAKLDYKFDNKKLGDK